LMPYQAKPNPNRKPSPEAVREAKALAQRWDVHWIKRWDVTQRLSDAQIHAIKQAIAAGHPVASGLRWPNKGDDLIDVPPADKVFDGHSILLVGYEDDASKPGGGVFVFRNSWGPKWGNNGYGNMSYAYARTYANDALWLQLGAPRSEIPTVQFEAEHMPATASGKATAAPQDMADFGGSMWSNGKQLLCQAEVGGFIDLTFNVRQAGKYRVRVLATAAPDFGIIRASMGGKADGSFDLYSGRVCPSGPLELGTHELAAGKHTIRFSVTGKNPGSKGHSFGLDTIDLFAEK
ncbi:MAG TPA: C1 family peptidase, partial [Gemmata sp.]|nr:C1 family peptidase [Gemmata sp.]